MARSVPTRSLTKSVGSAAASAGAARRRPAAQPPVAATSAATRSSSNTYPVAASIAAASSTVNRSCSARTSTRLPAARSLPRGIGGSRRPASTTRTCGGRSRSSDRSPSTAAGSLRSCGVVQHDRQRLGDGVQAVGDGREEVRVGGRVVGGHEVVQRVADGHHRAAAQRAEQDRPEPAAAVVDGRERHPHGVHGVGAQPVGEQRGLAPARRGADQHDVARRAPGRAGRAAACGRRAPTAARGSRSGAAHRGGRAGRSPPTHRPHDLHGG